MSYRDRQDIDEDDRVVRESREQSLDEIFGEKPAGDLEELADTLLDESQYAADVLEDAIDSSMRSQSLGQMCLSTIELLQEEADVKAKLKEIQRKLVIYRERLIPQTLATMGVSSLRTDGGLEIEMAHEVVASFPKDDYKREQAFQYLRSVGSAGLIVTKIGLEFGLGTDDMIRELSDYMKASGMYDAAGVTKKRGINHNSMLKFLREQLREGKPVPLEHFGAFVHDYAKIRLK